MGKLTKFKKLKKSYPNLFPKEWLGIECGDGWIELINILCQYFDNMIKSKNVNFIQFAQIKEKFGLLRIYFNLELPILNKKTEDPNRIFYEIHQTVATIEEISSIVCEDCGQMKHERFNVKMRSIGGWKMTKCDECFKKYRKERMKK